MENSFFEMKLKINEQMSDIISDICFDKLSCEGILTSDENNGVENLDKNMLTVYLTSEKNIEKILQSERKILKSRGFSDEELGSWDFEIKKIANQDWSKKWKENWDVTKIGQNLKIVPITKSYSPQNNEIIINLDAETAFGTGCHATTQLCVEAIEKFMKRGASFADIGTGTGILALCAVKLGAKAAYGCDNDKNVIKTAKNNAKINNISDKCYFEFKTANKINEKFDFVCANILHFILIEIMPDLSRIMKDGAYLSLSGILEEKGSLVKSAILKNGLKIIEEQHKDIWTGFVCQK